MWTNIPKENSENVSGSQLLKAINSYLGFKGLRRLTIEQVEHFYTRIMQVPNYNGEYSYKDFNTTVINMNNKCTSWGWLYATFCTLNAEPLKQLWNNVSH